MSDCCNEFEFTSPQETFYMDGGIRGKDGVTFYPHVSAAGVLSWTNDGGKQNPDPVNIKGEDGKSAYAAAQEAGFTGTEQEFNAYLAGIGDLTEDVSDLKSALGFSNIELVNGKRYSTTGTSVNVDSPSSSASAKCKYLPCVEGDIFIYTGNGSTSSRSWAFLDSENNIIGELPPPAVYCSNKIIIAPPNSAGVVFNFINYTTNPPELIKGMMPVYNPYSHKMMSVMGDSISAYTGEIPSGLTPYYTGNNAGVSAPYQMWYNIVAQLLGMGKGVINSDSGSCVTSGVRDDATYIPASSTERCKNLGTKPDVILIAMGVNDYSYMSSAAQFGTWDGTTALGSSADMSDYTVTDFRSAYATMLARIQKKYPKAQIICLTPWFTQRHTTDTGVTYLNAISKTERDYADAIKEIAAIMGCRVIDTNIIGFNRYNYYPTYASDSSSVPTHPNQDGQLVCGLAVVKELLNIALRN